MRFRIARTLALGVLALLLAAASPPESAFAQAAAQPAERRIAIAIHPLEGDALLYRAERTVRRAEGRVTETTEFTTPAGEPVQRTEAVYEADTLAPVSWRLEDLRSGEEERLERDGGTVRMAYREQAGEEVDEDTVDYEAGQLLSATVVPFLLRHWERLMRGEQVDFPLLVPSRQDVFSFRLMRDDEAAGAGPQRRVVRMEPDSWLVRRLVDPLFFVLKAAPPHRLLEFRGRSTVKDDAGETQDLRYVYAYPDA